MSIGPPQASSIRTSPSIGKRWRKLATTRCDGLAVVGEDRTDATVEARRADASAEGDAAILRGSEVADREARVGDRLAAGPAELSQPIGDRLGQDHVAAPGQHPGPEARPAGRPGVHRQHPSLGGDAAACGRASARRSGAGLDALDGGPLVDLTPRSSRTRRRPRARSAGWTVAALGMKTPFAEGRRGATSPAPRRGPGEPAGPARRAARGRRSSRPNRRRPSGRRSPAGSLGA